MKVYKFRNNNTLTTIETTDFSYFDNENFTFMGSRDIKVQHIGQKKAKKVSQASRNAEIEKLRQIINMAKERRLWGDHWRNC